jgi:hypothetical protein
MTLRRLTVAMMLVCGLCVWGFAHSDGPAGADPVRTDGDGDGGTREDAEARYRANQSRHWRHVAVGNCSMSR